MVDIEERYEEGTFDLKTTKDSGNGSGIEVITTKEMPQGEEAEMHISRLQGLLEVCSLTYIDIRQWMMRIVILAMILL